MGSCASHASRRHKDRPAHVDRVPRALQHDIAIAAVCVLQANLELFSAQIDQKVR